MSKLFKSSFAALLVVITVLAGVSSAFATTPTTGTVYDNSTTTTPSIMNNYLDGIAVEEVSGGYEVIVTIKSAYAALITDFTIYDADSKTVSPNGAVYTFTVSDVSSPLEGSISYNRPPTNTPYTYDIEVRFQ